MSERRACRVLGQSRTTQRRQHKTPQDEPHLVREMTKLATSYGRYGYRRVTGMLREDGWQVNHKRIERLWRREGLKVPQRQLKRRRVNGGEKVQRLAVEKCSALVVEGPRGSVVGNSRRGSFDFLRL